VTPVFTPAQPGTPQAVDLTEDRNAGTAQLARISMAINPPAMKKPHDVAR
jgi:hypothetical protein